MNRRYLALTLLLFLATNAFPNAAQPGFWNAGGTGTFSLLYPEDSAAYQKIQMVRELVTVQLYRGFAVVKGSYWMYNETADTVRIRTGYPLNASYSGESANHYNREEIRFDSLYGLQARVEGLPAAIIATPLEDPEHGYGTENWYVWTTDFPPGDTTYIEVYFVVNTNDTQIIQGYDREHHNGFIYLLETGSTWKQPIVEGEVRIQLMEDLAPEEISGVAPDSIFGLSSEGKILLTRFQNLSPTGDNNIVLAYGEKRENFDFSEALSRQSALYEAIDAFAATDLESRTFTSITFGDPFEVGSSVGSYAVGFLMMAAIFGGPILLLIGVILAVVVIYRMIRRRNSGRA